MSRVAREGVALPRRRVKLSYRCLAPVIPTECGGFSRGVTLSYRCLAPVRAPVGHGLSHE
jgi:hypothetical protein